MCCIYYLYDEWLLTIIHHFTKQIVPRIGIDVIVLMERDTMNNNAFRILLHNIIIICIFLFLQI